MQGTINSENFVNNIAKLVGTEGIEDRKITDTKLKSDHQKIRDNRKDRIENLKQQMKGPDQSGGKCLGALKVFTSIIDFMMKPISMLTMNQLKTDLTKALTNIQKLKEQGQMVKLQINSQKLSKTVDNLKSMLNEHLTEKKDLEAHQKKDTQRILQIIDQLHEGYKSTNRI